MGSVGSFPGKPSGPKVLPRPDAQPAWRENGTVGRPAGATRTPSGASFLAGVADHTRAKIVSEDETPTSFQHAIRKTHGARSQLLTREHVVEKVEGATVWKGEVLVFPLRDHPTAHLCYAWEVDGQVTAVLHEGPVDSPVKAVRASILAEVRWVHQG